MNIYQRRWENAKRIANTFNDYFDKGYIILMGSDINEPELMRMPNKFTITEDQIVMKYGHYTYGYFTNDVEYDEGMLTPIKEYNEQFKNWLFIDPKAIQKVKL